MSRPERPLAFRLPLLRGEEVRAAQLALLRAGEAPGEPDGVFGPRTAEAVRRFQHREGLPATGVLDTLTAERLFARARAAPEPSWREGLALLLPALTAWHGAPLGGGARRWRLARGGVILAGEAAPRRNAGLRQAERAWQRLGPGLSAAARESAVPVDLLLAAALVGREGGGPPASPLGTSLAAAAEALGRPDLDAAELADPARAAAAAAAVMRRQAHAGASPTGFDPPLVAIAHRMGALLPDADPANPWGLRQPPHPAAGWHADAFLAAFGDAQALFSAAEPPPADTPSLWEVLA